MTGLSKKQILKAHDQDEFQLKYNEFVTNFNNKYETSLDDPKFMKIINSYNIKSEKSVKNKRSYFVGIDHLNKNAQSDFYLTSKKYTMTIKFALYKIIHMLGFDFHNVSLKKTILDKIKFDITTFKGKSQEIIKKKKNELIKQLNPIQDDIKRNIVIFDQYRNYTYKYQDNRRTIAVYQVGKYFHPVVGINKTSPFDQTYDFDAKIFKSTYGIGTESSNSNLTFTPVRQSNKQKLQKLMNIKSKFSDKKTTPDTKKDDKKTDDDDGTNANVNTKGSIKPAVSGKKVDGNKATIKIPKILRMARPQEIKLDHTTEWLTFNRMDNNQNLPSIQIKINNKGESNSTGNVKLYLGGEINGYHTLYDVDSSLSGNVKVVGKIYFTNKAAQLGDIFWIKDYLKSLEENKK